MPILLSHTQGMGKELAGQAMLWLYLAGPALLGILYLLGARAARQGDARRKAVLEASDAEEPPVR